VNLEITWLFNIQDMEPMWKIKTETKVMEWIKHFA